MKRHVHGRPALDILLKLERGADATMTPCGLDMSFMRYYERVNVKQCLGLRKIPSACTKLRARQQGLPGKCADSRAEVAQIPSNNTSTSI